MRNIYLKEGLFKINRPGQSKFGGMGGPWSREMAIKENEIKKVKKK